MMEQESKGAERRVRELLASLYSLSNHTSEFETSPSSLPSGSEQGDELLRLLQTNTWLASGKYAMDPSQQQKKKSLLYHVCKSQCSPNVVRRVVDLFPEAACLNEDKDHPSALALLLAPQRTLNRVEDAELMELIGYVGTLCPEAFSRINTACSRLELHLQIQLTPQTLSVFQKYPILLKVFKSLAVQYETDDDDEGGNNNDNGQDWLEGATDNLDEENAMVHEIEGALQVQQEEQNEDEGGQLSTLATAAAAETGRTGTDGGDVQDYSPTLLEAQNDGGSFTNLAVPRARLIRQLLSMTWDVRDIQRVNLLHLRTSPHHPDLEITFSEDTSQRDDGVVLQAQRIEYLLAPLQDVMNNEKAPSSSVEHLKIDASPNSGSITDLLQSIMNACTIHNVTIVEEHHRRQGGDDSGADDDELHSIVEQLQGKRSTCLKCVKLRKYVPNLVSGGPPPSLVGFACLHTLVLSLRGAGDVLVDPLVELLEAHDHHEQQLQYLDVRGSDITDPTRLLRAVGRSKHLRHLGCEVSCLEHLRILLDHLEQKNNTSLTMINTEPIVPSFRRYYTIHSRKKQLGVYDKNMKALLDAVQYYCCLNHIGRGRLRTEADQITKTEFVETTLTDLETDDTFENFFHLMYIRDRGARSVSLLYGLLRENPAIWCGNR